MQIACTKLGYKESIPKLHIEHAYTTCNQELTLSELSLHFCHTTYSCQSAMRKSGVSIPSPQTGEKP